MNGLPLQVLSSSAETDLISVNYTKVRYSVYGKRGLSMILAYPNTTLFQADPDGPLFYTVFGGIEQLIEAQFTAMDITLHKEGFGNFQTFALSLFER